MTLHLKYLLKRTLGYFDNTANVSNIYGKSGQKDQMTYDVRFPQE